MKLKMLLDDGKPVCCITAETVGEARALAVMCTQRGWDNAPPLEPGASATLDVTNVAAQCVLQSVAVPNPSPVAPPEETGENPGIGPGNPSGNDGDGDGEH